MKQSEKESFEQALVECIKTQLIRKGKLAIPGFGSFSVSHRSATLTETDNSNGPAASSGEQRMSVSPPKTIVLFNPEIGLPS
ncbi:MAG: HU family DNA-binding protein [Bacteroidetes bacterium]|nr:HU family DNA-binding protein [Bacteroidota bacterium]